MHAALVVGSNDLRMDYCLDSYYEADERTCDETGNEIKEEDERLIIIPWVKEIESLTSSEAWLSGSSRRSKGEF